MMKPANSNTDGNNCAQKLKVMNMMKAVFDSDDSSSMGDSSMGADSFHSVLHQTERMLDDFVPQKFDLCALIKKPSPPHISSSTCNTTTETCAYYQFPCHLLKQIDRFASTNPRVLCFSKKKIKTVSFF